MLDLQGETAAFQLLHVPRGCKHCVAPSSGPGEGGGSSAAGRAIRFWCGFSEVPVADDPRAYTKVVEAEFRHSEFRLLNKSFGVSREWLRRWRYRLLVHRASFQGEAAILHLMHGPRCSCPGTMQSFRHLGKAHSLATGPEGRACGARQTLPRLAQPAD